MCRLFFRLRATKALLRATRFLPFRLCCAGEDAASSLADFWLRKALEAELPVLGDPAADDMAKVSALRSWVCRNVPRAPRDSPHQLSAPMHAGWCRRPAAELMRRFVQRRAAAMCGGISVVLLKVYRLFGYDGFVYGFGVADQMVTHVVTVVQISWRGEAVHAIQDAHFNLEVTNSGGVPVDFFDLMQWLRAERHSEHRLQQHEDGEHDYLDGYDTANGPNATVQRRKSPDLRKWLSSKPMAQLAPGLAFPSNFLHLFLHPMSVSFGLCRGATLWGRLRALFVQFATLRTIRRHAASSDDELEASSFWFRRYLEARFPVLSDPNATDLLKAHTLREFAFQTINRSPRDAFLQLPDRWGNDYYHRSAPELFRAFLNHDGSTMCHGNAYAMTRLCEIFGMRGFVYNMGIPDVPFTHAVAVITIRDGAAERAIVEDAHLGMTIQDSSGCALDLFDMLARLREYRHETLRIRFQKNLNAPYLVYEGHRFINNEVLQDVPPERVGKDTYLFRQQINVQNWCERWNLPGLMSARGYPPVFLYLFCLPIGVFADGGSETTQANLIKRRIQAACEQ